jgi:acetyl-CoA carboxylase biotin carboxylase subunit
MFRRILIANRGEVAVRVLKTCRRLGIEAVAVTSSADRELSWLSQADAVVEIGGPRSYLDMDALIEAAVAERCSAVHPGWGFLAENATFAARCEAAGLSFVGPRPLSMRQMADKSEARATMVRLGLPPIPGSKAVLPTIQAAREVAGRFGYPVLLKALAGGGGRGMRRVFAEAELAGAFQEASAEAAGAFGDGGLYLEKLIERGRHVELQVIGDGRGGARVLGARECSVQRRHQKLIEETPAPGVSAEVYEETRARVEAVVSALRYRGAGTVEMLQDVDGKLWFMEMNTRLQVEHTVTEEVSGIDLVEWQLRVAANQELAPIDAIEAPGGHAIECRINAEDVGAGFQPVPGKVEALELPEGPGIRVDTHLSAGDRISPHYDSMFAKIIAHGPDRATAIARMQGALGSLRVEGLPTTVPVHTAVLAHPQFQAGKYDTGFLESTFAALLSGGAATAGAPS